MAGDRGEVSNDVDACVGEVIRRVGKEITLGLPLGLGKPVRFVNALYQRAKDDPEISLHIVTALSLLAPKGGSSLEKRFMGPFVERLYAGFLNWPMPRMYRQTVFLRMFRSRSFSSKPAVI